VTLPITGTFYCLRDVPTMSTYLAGARCESAELVTVLPAGGCRRMVEECDSLYARPIAWRG